MPSSYVTSHQNKLRAVWAEEALITFARTVGGEWELKNDTQEVVSDLLCDLMHFCKQKGIDWEVLIIKAASHYYVEAKGKE